MRYFRSGKVRLQSDDRITPQPKTWRLTAQEDFESKAMFVLLSRVLLLLLLGAILVSLFQRFYPSGTFVGRLFLVILVIIVILSFINPNEPAVASLWRVVSFPLKPLGASILLLIFASQRIKGGGIDKPGGYLVGWALTILLLASTPAVAFLITRSPVASLSSPSEVLVAWTPHTTPSNMLNVVDDSILPSRNLDQAMITFNSPGTRVAPYLLQTPTNISSRRGLRLEDFVPNAETLSLTTRVWESYLNQIYIFLRGNRR